MFIIIIIAVVIGRYIAGFLILLSGTQVPDYYDIIVEPMDLSTIMKKIDEHRYTVPKQWITDVNLIAKNALE